MNDSAHPDASKETSIAVAEPAYVNEAAETPVKQTDETEAHEPANDVEKLRAAFPDMDVGIIEDTLRSQEGNVEHAFDLLLSMSDPNYRPSTPERHATVSPELVHMQMQQDEDLARRLSAPNRQAQRDHQSSQTSTPEYMSKEYVSKELLVMKEKAIEAGMTTKKKMVDFYNNFMASRAPHNPSGVQSSRQANSMSNDMSHLRLSEREKRPTETQSKLQTMNDDRALAIRLQKEEDYLRHIGKCDESPLMEKVPTTSSLAAKRAKSPTAEDGNPVTFNAPGSDPKENKPPRASYVISDDDDLDDLHDAEKVPDKTT